MEPSPVSTEQSGGLLPPEEPQVDTRASPRISNIPPSSNLDRSADESRADMVFYPAPVPRVLDLPPKLSNRVPGTRPWRRNSRIAAKNSIHLSTHTLGNPSTDIDGDGDPSEVESTVNIDALLPQIGAARQSRQRPMTSDLQLQDGSAAATFDMLLEASAHAPVSAFTDHLIAGAVDTNMFGDAPRALPDRDLSGIVPEMSNSELHRSGANGSIHDHISNDGFGREDANRKPNTLLAELEMRKRQQSSRNKTAAYAIPSGLHATLLQQDVVAQMERDTRKSRHVTLAWEESIEIPSPTAEEDDVPLALLKPKSKRAELDDDVPIGLISQRQVEENEPLSSRRARLRRNNPTTSVERIRNQLDVAGSSLSKANRAKLEEDQDEEEGETLAQRRRKLQVQTALPSDHALRQDLHFTIFDDLDQHISADLFEKSGREDQTHPDELETLLQRRHRLRSEKLRKQTGNSAQAFVPEHERAPQNSSGRLSQKSAVVHGVHEAEVMRPLTSFHGATGPPTAMIERWRQSLT